MVSMKRAPMPKPEWGDRSHSTLHRWKGRQKPSLIAARTALPSADGLQRASEPGLPARASSQVLPVCTHDTASATKACSMKCVSTPQPSISVRRAAG